MVLAGKTGRTLSKGYIVIIEILSAVASIGDRIVNSVGTHRARETFLGIGITGQAGI